MKKNERFKNDLTSHFTPRGGGLTAPPLDGENLTCHFKQKANKKFSDEKIKEKRSQWCFLVWWDEIRKRLPARPPL